MIISQDATARSIADNVRVQEEATKSQAEANKSLDAKVSVALGTTTIDSTPTIGVRWHRVPSSTGQISPPMAERQTGSDRFPELGAFVSNHKGLITFGREHRRRRSQTHLESEKTERTTEPRPALKNRFRLELDLD